MTQQNHDSGAPKFASSRLAHWLRVAVMVLSCGMVYPNAMAEGIDMTKYDAENEAESKK